MVICLFFVALAVLEKVLLKEGERAFRSGVYFFRVRGRERDRKKEEKRKTERTVEDHLPKILT